MTTNNLPIKYHHPARSTAIGFSAIGLWSALAVLTKFSGEIPPFELMALSFSVAFMASTAFLARKGRAGFQSWKQPVSAWAYSFTGLFVYHALYFFALRKAPVAQASLIAYLWPLLIVVFAATATRSEFKFQHLAGAMLGFFGAVLVVGSGNENLAHAEGTVWGYAAAVGCAITWSVYSVANRRFQDVPSDFIGGVCGLVAVSGACLHLLTEPTVWPAPHQWIAIVLLGIGPVGLAFMAWDHATKHGHVSLLGATSYAAPLLSTLLLILFGFVPVRWSLVGAAALIVAGSFIASFRFDSNR